MPGISQQDSISLAHSKLLSFACMNWPEYIIGKHHLLVSHYLQAIETRQINRLIINMPPRHGKTMLIGQNFMPWYMGRHPDHQIIYATYGYDKAGDVGGDVRNTMCDPLFAQIFPNCQVDQKSKGKNKLSTLQGGNVFSVGTGGALTGRGAHCLIIDDPIKNREDADSDIVQAKLRNWFKGVAYTRLMKDAAIIINLTRWHHYDLVGWVLDELKHENWHHLSLPALCEDDGDAIGRNEGESLWPEKYNEERLAVTRMTIGTREWNAQYQQRPTPTEGGMVSLDDFGRYPWKEWAVWFNSNNRTRPPFDITKFAISWDTAFKEREINDPSAATVWGIANHGVYMVGLVNKRMLFPDLRRKALDLYETYNRLLTGATPVLIEDKASGQSLIQDLKKSTRIPVIACKPESNKIIRFDSVAPLIEAGKVYLPEQSPWLVSVETQIERFPHDKHDDIVDSISQFLRWQLLPKRKRTKLKFWK